MIEFLLIGFLTAVVGVGIGYFRSGWLDLRERFPDRTRASLQTFPFCSAIVSNGWNFGCSFPGVLRFQLCEDGLRVGMIQPFSVLTGSFFVPWAEVRFEDVPPLLGQARITFGKPMVGAVAVSSRLAQRVALARQTR